MEEEKKALKVCCEMTFWGYLNGRLTFLPSGKEVAKCPW